MEELTDTELLAACTAVRIHASYLRNQAKSRVNAGTHNKSYRESLREQARDLDKLGLKLHIMSVGQIPAK